MTVTVVKADGSQQSLTDDVLDVLRSNNNIVPMP